jgi:hypothetical protein
MDSIPGVPAGWKTWEKNDLKSGFWRFFHISDPERRESVYEDNLVTRAGEVMRGEDGLKVLLKDNDWYNHPEALPPDKLACQAGMFIYRGSSRASCEFGIVTDPSNLAGEYPNFMSQVKPPVTTMENGVQTLRAWIRRHALQPITITMNRNGIVTLKLGDMVGREVR